MIDLDPERLVRSPFLIGALGSLVALRGAPGESWPIRIFNVVSGALMAGYVGPALAEFFSLGTPAMQSAMAFAVGLFGMNFVATAVTWIKQLQLSDVLPWVRRKE
ncbi:hypothetical protein [Variovorax sp. GT1P44]|uniref:hypothetical protein n=1 Tax=Variovorax sp. GT1P44 TaxID=3443742 RepID=UPI003F44EC2D